MRQTGTRGADALRMEDVAAHAGVSPMTVSRALRDPNSVSKTMRDRVARAVNDTGYVPNHLAGSLSSQRSQVIGLIVPGISNSLYASMTQAIESVLREHGYHLLIAASDHDPASEEAAIAAFLSQRVCGLILHSTHHTDRAKLLVRTSSVPTVEIGRLTHTPLDLCVGSSGFAAAKAMVMHLGGLGYRRIGFVSLPLRNNERSVERRRGYQAALKALGLGDPGLVVEAGPGFPGGVDALLQLVAIASFDDVELLSHTVPTITTLRIPREEIGRRSAAMLVARLQGQPGGPRVVDLKFEIIARESTACPRATTG
jgi:LacI family gluconate utilization system Gnt-I transcriptional repressor